MSLDFGTKELANHTRLVIEPRNISRGGNVIDTGRRNIIPDLLEVLYVEGHLKGQFENEATADNRVANGRGFQALREIFDSKGKEFGATEMVYALPITLEGHIGTDRDIAQTVYGEVLRHMGTLGGVVESVCITGHVKDSCVAIRMALDALPKAMEYANDLVRDRMERIKDIP